MPMATPMALPETRKEQDLRLLKEWKGAKNSFEKERALSALLTALGGAIGYGLNSFRGAPLPFQVMELESKRTAVEALNDYDPNKGTSLATFITTRVKQRLARYVGTYQNVARLPEAQIQQVGPLREAVADLSSRYHREPTTDELADYMAIPVKHIERLRKNLRQDLLAESGGLDALESHEADPDFEKAMLVFYSLSVAEKQVFDYSLGAHGQPKLQAQEIAKRLKISPGRVSQLKASIAAKITPYISVRA